MSEYIEQAREWAVRELDVKPDDDVLMENFDWLVVMSDFAAKMVRKDREQTANELQVTLLQMHTDDAAEAMWQRIIDRLRGGKQ